MHLVVHVLKLFLPEEKATQVIDIAQDVLDIIKPESETSSVNFSQVLAQKEGGSLDSTGIALRPEDLTDGVRIINDSTYHISGAGKEHDELVYLEPTKNNDVLKNAMIEADFVYEKGGDQYATIAFGLRGYKTQQETDEWRGYNFMVVPRSKVMKVVESDPAEPPLADRRIGLINEGDRCHLICAVKDNEGLMALINYSTGATYQFKFQLSSTKKGNRVYLHAWKADVKFTNLHVTAL